LSSNKPDAICRNSRPLGDMRKIKQGMGALDQRQSGLLGSYVQRPETADPKQLEKMADIILGLGQAGFKREFKAQSTINRITRSEVYSKTGSAWPIAKNLDGTLSLCRGRLGSK
jgi:hypothetical protein